MKFDYTSKSVVVTGGGSGIGEAISRTLALQGATIHLLDTNLKTTEQVANDIIAQGGKAFVYSCDVSNWNTVFDCIDKILKKYESIDVLINNAGIAHVGSIENTDEDDLDRLYQINIKGVFNCCKAVIPHFKKSRKGVILNLASIASSVGISDRFAYSMTKGAVLTMTYSIAKDYIHDGIRCNSISPARVHTPFVDGFIQKNYPGQEDETFKKLSLTQPIGRMGQPQEIADLVLYLCSEEAGFITGTDFPIDGGYIKLQG